MRSEERVRMKHGVVAKLPSRALVREEIKTSELLKLFVLRSAPVDIAKLYIHVTTQLFFPHIFQVIKKQKFFSVFWLDKRAEEKYMAYRKKSSKVLTVCVQFSIFFSLFSLSHDDKKTVELSYCGEGGGRRVHQQSQQGG
jgi:hypothetical protein